MKQRDTLLAKLLAAGINVKHQKRSDLSTDKLRALLAVIEED